MLAAVLVAGLMVAGSVRAEDEEEDNDRDRGNDREVQKLQMKKMHMALEERQAEIGFRNEMRRLDLDLKRIEIEKQRSMLKNPMVPHSGGPGVQAPNMRGCPMQPRPGEPGVQAPNRPGCPMQSRRGGPEVQQAQGWHHQAPSHGKAAHCLMFVMICGIIHILMTIWVYQDIRKRNAGSGIWIVVALLTGLLGTLVYAVVRLGDAKQA